MSKFKFHWGWAIVVVFLTFMIIFSYQFWLSFKINETNYLMVDDYYTAELQYGDELNKIHHADTMKIPVKIYTSKEKISIRFPHYISKNKLSGEINLLRINNKNLDQKFSIRLDSTNTQIISGKFLIPGRWDVMIHWKIDSTEYLKKEKLYLK